MTLVLGNLTVWEDEDGLVLAAGERATLPFAEARRLRERLRISRLEDYQLYEPVVRTWDMRNASRSLLLQVGHGDVVTLWTEQAKQLQAYLESLDLTPRARAPIVLRQDVRDALEIRPGSRVTVAPDADCHPYWHGKQGTVALDQGEDYAPADSRFIVCIDDEGEDCEVAFGLTELILDVPDPREDDAPDVPLADVTWGKPHEGESSYGRPKKTSSKPKRRKEVKTKVAVKEADRSVRSGGKVLGGVKLKNGTPLFERRSGKAATFKGFTQDGKAKVLKEGQTKATQISRATLAAAYVPGA